MEILPLLLSIGGLSLFAWFMSLRAYVKLVQTELDNKMEEYYKKLEDYDIGSLRKFTHENIINLEKNRIEIRKDFDLLVEYLEVVKSDASVVKYNKKPIRKRTKSEVIKDLKRETK